MPRIIHNISAMITGDALRAVDRQMQTSLERLSTGLRINRAADDAAGLSISEQITTQVNGLAMGDRNAQDGKSLVNISLSFAACITGKALTNIATITNNESPLIVIPAFKIRGFLVFILFSSLSFFIPELIIQFRLVHVIMYQ